MWIAAGHSGKSCRARQEPRDRPETRVTAAVEAGREAYKTTVAPSIQTISKQPFLPESIPARRLLFHRPPSGAERASG